MSPMMFLGQMFPLLVFIIVDMLFNNIRISIISAIAFAVVQLVLILMPDSFLLNYFGRMMPKGMWAFVSGPGFYLLFIPVMGVIIAKRARLRRR